MSSIASNRTITPDNCSISSSGSEHQLITYYQDVTEEVDSHFNRALSLSSTSSCSCTDMQITFIDGYTSPFSPAESPNNTTAPLNTSSTSLISSSNHSLSNEELPLAPYSLNRAPGPVSLSLTSIDGEGNEAINPSQDGSSSTTTTTRSTLRQSSAPPDCSGPNTGSGDIVHPELSKNLVHPIIDSYSDAPRVPGQPATSFTEPPSTTVPYIKGITITVSDIHMVTSCRLRQHSRRMGGAHYSGTGCYTTQYTAQPFPSTRQYNSDLVTPASTHPLQRSHPYMNPPPPPPIDPSPITPTARAMGSYYVNNTPPQSVGYPFHSNTMQHMNSMGGGQQLSHQPVAPPTNHLVNGHNVGASTYHHHTLPLSHHPSTISSSSTVAVDPVELAIDEILAL